MARAEVSHADSPDESGTVRERVPDWLLAALAATSADEDITITLPRGRWGSVLGAVDQTITWLEAKEQGHEPSGFRKSLETAYCEIHDALTAQFEETPNG